MTVVYALKTSVLRYYNLLVCDASMVTLLCDSITKGSYVAIPSNSWPVEVRLWLCGRLPDLQSGGCGNIGLGYFTPRSTQPSIAPGSVNEYQLQLGRQRQVWLIWIADERVGVQVKLWNPLITHAIPEYICLGDSLRRSAKSSVCTFTFTCSSAEESCCNSTDHPRSSRKWQTNQWR